MTALAPCHGMHLPPCVQVLRTGQSDKDETKDELGSQAHCFQAGGMGAPAQEPAQSPPRAAEDHAPHAETQGVAEALDPGFAEREEHPEEPSPEEPGVVNK